MINEDNDIIKKQAEAFAIREYESIEAIYKENTSEFLRHFCNKLEYLRAKEDSE